MQHSGVKHFAVGEADWLKEQLKSSGIKRMNIKQSYLKKLSRNFFKQAI
jgi:hypothetical protein